MENYIAVVFDNDEKAFDGLHELWRSDGSGDATVHGAAVIHRDKYGHVDVATKDTDTGIRTFVGAGIGALLGALGGPVGAAAGVASAASVAAGAGIGAATGGTIGLTVDALKAGEHEEAARETSFVMNPGQSAVIAEVAEDWTTPIDTAMKRIGGVVYRRSAGVVRDNSFFGDDYSDYLYPYDYQPRFVS